MGTEVSPSAPENWPHISQTQTPSNTSPSVEGSMSEYLESQMTSPTPFAGPEEMLGKEAAQSCAKYLNAFQVCPKSVERSTSIAAGRNVCKKHYFMNFLTRH